MISFLDRVLLLVRTPIFREVATDDLRIVAEQLGEEPCFAGDRVFDINDPSDRMFIVQSGRVGISLDADPTWRNYVSVLGPGECFGEMGLFDDLARSATAHVIEDGMLLTLGKAKLRGLLLAYPQLSIGLLRGLSLRLRGTNEIVQRTVSLEKA